MLIKCPYCGSTAQVKRELAVPSESPNGAVLSVHYKCGCGCHFAKHFEWTDTEILWIEDIRKK